MVVLFCDATYGLQVLWCQVCPFNCVMPPRVFQFCDVTYFRSVLWCHPWSFTLVMPPYVDQMFDATYGRSILCCCLLRSVLWCRCGRSNLWCRLVLWCRRVDPRQWLCDVTYGCWSAVMQFVFIHCVAATSACLILWCYLWSLSFVMPLMFLQWAQNQFRDA